MYCDLLIKMHVVCKMPLVRMAVYFDMPNILYAMLVMDNDAVVSVRKY